MKKINLNDELWEISRVPISEGYHEKGIWRLG